MFIAWVGMAILRYSIPYPAELGRASCSSASLIQLVGKFVLGFTSHAVTSHVLLRQPGGRVAAPMILRHPGWGGWSTLSDSEGRIRVAGGAGSSRGSDV